MAEHPTERQAKVLHFIGSFIDKHGYAPTFAEIGKHLGTEKPSAFGLIDRLIESDWLTKTPAHQRSLELTAKGKAWHERATSDIVPALTFAESITQHAAPGVE